ncbi:TauD/TfdA family dioxygenase [Curtobacterium sp. MCBA15_012]|uniref:TauD/TfdA family dioxygenase n=1 Tax=Curtobacterium sp. MCBA15_012 TaxID=1898738 RepID=UPI0008DC7F16|nr:TauD/TfdA family dioxygenase [Curtobacterium sp. MCBA15_012]WIB00349.1 TauD/TfdA family dioxygenase [Curtobacterium sp. MCBA15_012]
MTRAEAPQRSLSATYGLGAQPLHTDGAHLIDRPDVIMLACTEPSATDTLVRFFEPGDLPDFVFTGIFTVNTGKSKFLAPAYDGAIRFDPVAMRPSDYLARRTVAHFADERANAYHHRWDSPDLLLFINNRRSLHARDALSGDATTRRVTRYAFRIERDA